MPENDDSRLIEWLRADNQKIYDLLGGVDGKVNRLATLFEVHLDGHEKRGGRWWTLLFQVTSACFAVGGTVLVTLAAAGKWPW